MFASHPSVAHSPYAASAAYVPRGTSRLEELERMISVQQHEAARLQALIHNERAALAHQHQMQMQQQQMQMQQQQRMQQQACYHPAYQAPYVPAHPYSVQQPYPGNYTYASPFLMHGHPTPQGALPVYNPGESWNRHAPVDPARSGALEDHRSNHARSRSSERRRAAEMEVTDRPRRSSSRSRAPSPPTNASRFEADVSFATRRSMGGFSTRSSSAPHSPPRSRSASRSKKSAEEGGATIDPESEESKKARDRKKKQNIIELEAAKQERKSEVAKRKKQAFNAEMTEYFRSKALKTPEVAYSRRFDSIKEWKETYLEAKAEAGAEERRAKSPPPRQVATDTETSYTGTATEELDRLFNASIPRRTVSPPRSSHASAAGPTYDRMRQSQSQLQGLAPEDAARVISRSAHARGSFEHFDDVSLQSSVVDTDRSGQASSRVNSRVTSPPRVFSDWNSAPAASTSRRVASPVSPTPRQQYARVRNRLQGEDASSLQTSNLFADMNLQVSSVGDDDDDISEALRFPPRPRSSQQQQQWQQPLRNLSDYTPSPSKLQQYLDAAKLQSPMHASSGARLVTPPTLHRYATLV